MSRLDLYAVAALGASVVGASQFGWALGCLAAGVVFFGLVAVEAYLVGRRAP